MVNLEREFKEKDIVRHFKGGKYLILAFGNSSEDNSEVVIYLSLNGDGKIWVRNRVEFESRIEEDRKGNKTGQLYRFVKLPK